MNLNSKLTIFIDTDEFYFNETTIGWKEVKMEQKEQKQSDKTRYTVLINDEEQYSLWFEHKEIPLGWKSTGMIGTKDECLQYVKDVWTDMRPLSLRKQMESDS